MKLLVPLILAAVLLLAGCGIAIDKRATANRVNLLELKIGDTKETLRKKMGVPHRNEQYASDGKTTEIWFYRTSRTPDDVETDDEFTPVAMVSEKVIGWGRAFYDSTIKIQSDVTIKQR